MKLINEIPCDTIPDNYDFANGLLYSIGDDSFQNLLLPFDMPHGDTIAEEYIQMLTFNSSYEHVYTESEVNGIQLPDFEIMKAKLLDYPALSNQNKLFLRNDELFVLLSNDNALSQMLVDMLDNRIFPVVVNNDDDTNTVTPPQSPREIKCPGAPIKKNQTCNGCRMLAQGLGGEAQAAHMEYGGCLDIKF